MKTKWLLQSSVYFAVVAFFPMCTNSQTVITFDDLPSSAGGAPMPTHYQGLVWSNFDVGNAILFSNASGYSAGYGYGMVSPSNVAFNGGGTPAEIDASGTNFDLLSTYLTGAWNSNLNIQVEGFRSGTLLYNTTVVVSATSPTLFTFDYLDIDRLYFDSYGGLPAFSPINNETPFVMDNFTFDFVPEPSSLLLTALGAVSLVAFLRRKSG